MEIKANFQQVLLRVGVGSVISKSLYLKGINLIGSMKINL